jgi:O-antigen/teichoic acid export membrane protein
VVGALLLPICLYTVLSSNLDFWDYYWLATDRPGLIFVYTCLRLASRVAVVVTAAALTHDVQTIIWALIALEAVRVLGTALVMAAADRGGAEPRLPHPWREQLRYCVPSGTASVLSTLNRSLGGLAVTKALGPVALAQYTIARYGEPIVVTLRNSVSSVVLPEMVRRDRNASRTDSLTLWKQATVTNAILLLPVVVIVARFARPLIEAVFGSSYAPAALVLQIYMIAVLRECFDFAPALRAINCTGPLVGGNVASIIACAALLAALIPLGGVAGAMAAVVLASWVEAVWLARATMRHYGVGLGELIHWSSTGRVAAAALLAAALLATSAWRQMLGPAGMALAAAAYLAAFALLLFALRVPEAYALLAWARRLVPSLHTASRKA